MFKKPCDRNSSLKGGPLVARKIDPNKSAEENLYTLISSNNSGLEVNSSKVTLGTPTPLSTPIGSRDTELPLTAVNNKGFSGTSKVRYNRLQLDQNIANAPKSFNLLNANETFESLKARICTAWSIIPSEVVFNNGEFWTLPTDQGSSKTLSIQPKAGSLVYNGDLINLTITLPVPAPGYADFVKFVTDTWGPVGTDKTERASTLRSGGYTADDGVGTGSFYADGFISQDTVIQYLAKRNGFYGVSADYLANKRVFAVVYGGTTLKAGNTPAVAVDSIYYWDEANQRAMVVAQPFYIDGRTPTPAPITLAYGEVVFTTPGTYQWTVPNNVYNICGVVVGGSAATYRYESDGGALGWKNNISVTPGQVITVVVGAAGSRATTKNGDFHVGGDSYIKDRSTLLAQGSTGGNNGSFPVPTFVGDGGGKGGDASGGGGGAGGYTSAGGSSQQTADSSGNSVGGTSTDGGSAGNYSNSNGYGGAGGGVGLEGIVPRRAENTSRGGGGIGGSGGVDGRAGNNSGGGTNDWGRGGLYGGGAGRATTPQTDPFGGSQGAARIIWGVGRGFPKTKTTQYYSRGNITLNGPYTPVDVRGETVFTKVGRNSFVVPDGVTTLSAVTVSGGAAMARGAGAGGTTAWKNNIPVTPGETLFVDVGPGQSQNSSASLRTAIYRGTTLLMVSEGPNGVNPGSFTADGGGLGGAGFLFNDGSGGGGGGAGGYTDKGGDWGSSYVYGTGTPGKGGGGGAGGNPGSDGTSLSNAGAGGGGVGLMGQGADGAGGQAGTTNSGGKGGSGGDNAAPVTSLSQVSGTSGAKFGGGAGGPLKNNVNATSVVGGQGGARLVWGKGRAFPATNVSQAFSDTIRNVA